MDNNAIHRAVYFQDIDGLKQMLDAGWNIDQLDDYQMTPLMLSLQSAERLSPEAAMLLIHRGANVNVSDKDGRTPLMCAAVGGRYPEMADESPKVLRALISKGAYVNVRDTRGNSALMTACWALRPELVLILLEHGAKVNVRSKDGSTALTAALTSPYTRTRGDDLRRVLRLLRYAGATK
jgi:ankyrin repeat protein